MSETERLPEIKEILGSMLFATQQPLTVRQMVNVFKRAGQTYEGITKEFESINAKQVEEALQELRDDLEEVRTGVEIVEIAGGYRMRNAPIAGPWLRELLDRGKPNKLSKPALETLSIIAYRQPLPRSEIESIRGVAVDSIVRSLLEMGLIKVVGRSDLPGKPWLYGSTQLFLEHFGLNSLDELPGMTEMRRNLERQQKLELEAQKAAAAAEEGEPEEATDEEEVDEGPAEETIEEEADDAEPGEDEDEFDEEDEEDDEDED